MSIERTPDAGQGPVGPSGIGPSGIGADETGRSYRSDLAVPQTPRRSNPRVSAAIIALLGGGAMAAAFAFTPAGMADGPTLCVFRIATGLPCPACGLTRSWVHMAHLEFGQAWTFNAFGPLFFVLTVVAVLVAVAVLASGRSGWAAPLMSRRVQRVGLVVVAVWFAYGIARLGDAALGWGIFPVIT